MKASIWIHFIMLEFEDISMQKVIYIDLDVLWHYLLFPSKPTHKIICWVLYRNWWECSDYILCWNSACCLSSPTLRLKHRISVVSYPKQLFIICIDCTHLLYSELSHMLSYRGSVLLVKTHLAGCNLLFKTQCHWPQVFLYHCYFMIYTATIPLHASRKLLSFTFRFCSETSWSLPVELWGLWLGLLGTNLSGIRAILVFWFIHCGSVCNSICVTSTMEGHDNNDKSRQL